MVDSGSGIGGLALSVALSRLGVDKAIEVDVYEATTKMAQVGAGITLYPRGWEILKQLGLESALSAYSATADEVSQRDNGEPSSLQCDTGGTSSTHAGARNSTRFLI
jgi:2-polyprenyl-6-methoxyphenol hydroxylase-like FAD-dependent oxidoreductase